MRYRLRLLGPPSLTDERGETPPGLGPGKALAVLCYLALEGEVRRDTVMALLWGDAPEDRARNAFRQALHRLRSALGDDVIPHDPDTVRISAGADLSVDYRAFERALAEGRPADAVELVAGELLEGFSTGEAGFDHWVDGERARLRARHAAALETAAQEALAQGSGEAAVALARRLTRLDPLDSAAALLEARALVGAGRAGEAERLLEAHAARYRAELGEEPPEDVAALRSRLHGGGRADEAGSVAAAPASGPVLRLGALQALLAEWGGVAEGRGGVVVLEGEPGSGKTWLADELVRRIQPTDRPLVLRGSERMGGRGLPYAPIAEALRGVLRARGLAGASTHLMAEAARLLPELRDRFDLPAAAPVADEGARLRFYEGVASLLEAVAFEQPALVILEGLGSSGERTQELVHFLATRLGDAAVLFLLVTDPGPAAAALRRRLEGRARVVPLGPVDPAALEALLADRAPRLAAEDRVRIAAAAGGNPTAALALATRVAEGGTVGGTPARLDDLLAARAAGATPRERRVLLGLALAGRPLSLRLLAAATHLPQGAVLEAVGALTAAGLVRERVDGAELARPAIADAVLEQAGPAGVALLAGWAADALAVERDASKSELATLYARAGRRGEAARYAEAAGREAAVLGERHGAGAEYRRALGWTEDPAARARLERLLAGLGQGSRSLPGHARRKGLPGARPSLVAGVGLLVVAIVAAAVLLQPRGVRSAAVSSRRIVRDTLVVVRTSPDGARTRLGITGVPGERAERPLVLGPAALPRWLDSATAAGGALPSPDGRRVLLGAGGGDAGGRLLAVSVDRGDTVVLATAAGVPRPLGWAPDGSRALFAVPGGRSGQGLWIASPGAPPVPVDTTPGRVVRSAAWSPDGVRIAWTAADLGENEEVLVAFSDGSAARNLTRNDADDFHVAWAPAGDRVAFTSERDGNAELYAIEVLSGRLWRLTWDPGHDDRAAFSPDGEFVAFESTRRGDAAVYVMSSWGGQPVRVTAEGQRVEHAGWRGYPPPRLSHLRFDLPPPLEPGAAGQVVVEPVHDDYVARNRGSVRWRALDPGIVALGPDPAGRQVPGAAVADTFVVARSAGLGRIVADAGGWRVDTAYVKVGTEAVEVGGGGGRGWVAVGDGALTRAAVPLTYGLTVAVTVPAGAAAATGPIVLGLVTPGAEVPPGAEPPLVVAIRLEGARLTYQVERETHSETLPPESIPGTLGFVVDDAGAVAFQGPGGVRWRSSLRVTGTGIPLHRARIWAGGAAAPEAVRIVVDPSDPAERGSERP